MRAGGGCASHTQNDTLDSGDKGLFEPYILADISRQISDFSFWAIIPKHSLCKCGYVMIKYLCCGRSAAPVISPSSTEPLSFDKLTRKC